MFRTLQAILSDERGQGLAEYGLILALVAVVCIGATRTLGTNVNTAMGSAAAGLVP